MIYYPIIAVSAESTVVAEYTPNPATRPPTSQKQNWNENSSGYSNPKPTNSTPCSSTRISEITA